MVAKLFDKNNEREQERGGREGKDNRIEKSITNRQKDQITNMVITTTKDTIKSLLETLNYSWNNIDSLFLY